MPINYPFLLGQVTATQSKYPPCDTHILAAQNPVIVELMIATGYMNSD